MIRARSARLRRVVAVRTHAVSCARSCAATANLVATAMPCLHHAITGMASELTRRDTSEARCSLRGGDLPISLLAAEYLGEADRHAHGTPCAHVGEVIRARVAHH